MEVSEVAFQNAVFPIDVTLVGIVIEVSEDAPKNAPAPIDVTPAGITAAPAHATPEITTPPLIVKLGVELDGSPVVQRYVPLAGTVACAGFEIKASNSAEMVAVITEYLRI